MSLVKTFKSIQILTKDASWRNELQKYFRQFGIVTYKTTGRGQNGFADINAENTPLDLIILEVKLEDMGGHDYLKIIRAEQKFHHTPVFIVYAEEERALVEPALPYHLLGFMALPTTGDTLCHSIDQRLKVRTIFAADSDAFDLDTMAYFFEPTDLPRANDIYQRLITSNDNPKTRFDLGRMYTLAKEKTLALENFSLAIQKDPDFKNLVVPFLKKHPFDAGASQAKARNRPIIPAPAIKVFNLPLGAFCDQFYSMESFQTALVVMNDLTEHTNVKNALIALGIKQISRASSGIELLDNLESGPPQLIIMREKLHDLGLLTILERAKTSSHRNKTKLLVVLDESDSANLRPAFELGLDGYIFTPVTKEAVCQRLHVTMIQEAFTVTGPLSKPYAKGAFAFYELDAFAQSIEIASRGIALGDGHEGLCYLYKAMGLHRTKQAEEANFYYDQAVQLIPEINSLCAEIKNGIHQSIFDPNQPAEIPESDLENQHAILQAEIEKEKQLFALHQPSSQTRMEMETTPVAPPQIENSFSQTSYEATNKHAPHNDLSLKSYEAADRDAPHNDLSLKSYEAADRDAPHNDLSLKSYESVDPEHTLNNDLTYQFSDEEAEGSYHEIKTIYYVDSPTSPAIGLKNKSQITNLSMGVTEAATAQKFGLEQTIGAVPTQLQAPDGSILLIKDGTARKWIEPKFLTSCQTPAKNDFGKIIQLCQSATPDFTKTDQMHIAAVKHMSVILRQAQLLNSRIIDPLGNSNPPASLEPYLNALGYSFSNQEVFATLGIAEDTLPKKIRKLLAAVRNDVTKHDQFTELGRCLIAAGYMNSFVNGFETILLTPNQTQTTHEYSAKITTMVTMADYLKDSIIRVHSDYYAANQQFRKQFHDVLHNPQFQAETPLLATEICQVFGADHDSLEAFKIIFSKIEQAGKLDLLEAFYHKKIKKFQQNDQLRKALAKFFIATEHPDKALDLLERLSTKDGNNIAYLKRLAIIAYRAQKYKITRKWAKKILHIDKTFEDAYNLIGVANKKLHRTEAAIRIYKKGIRFNPQSSKLYFNLAIALDTLGNSDEAVDALTTANKILEEAANIK